MRRFAFLIAILPFALSLAFSAAKAASPENTLYLDLKDGRVVIELRPDLAPKHVERIKQLVREGFYDGLTFHRVIEGFMAQTGDPKGDGTGGSKYANLPAEFSSEPFKRGTVGAARSASPNSANSQFFICFDERLAPDWQLHGLGPSHRRHAIRRQHQKGRRPPTAKLPTQTRSSKCGLQRMPADHHILRQNRHAGAVPVCMRRKERARHGIRK